MFSSNPAGFFRPASISPLMITLLERLKDAALLINNLGYFTYGNPSACKLLDCSVPDLLAMRVQDLPLARFSQVWSAPRSPAPHPLSFTDQYATGTDGELTVEITVSYEQGINRAYSCLLIRQVKSAVNETIIPKEESIFPNIPRLQEVFRFIEENYVRSISLKDVAEAIGYCPSYLTDLVRRCTGQTVNYWIIKRRIVLACNLLKETNRSVSQIALATGYQNEGHFFRQFRQHCGMPPAAWRKSQQVRGTL
jgi:AraC-like DNA-binding protein